MGSTGRAGRTVAADRNRHPEAAQNQPFMATGLDLKGRRAISAEQDARIAARDIVPVARHADATDGSPATETVLDLRGLRCPQPVLRAKKALRTIPVGGTLVLECTDPLTMIDVPAFTNQTGHTLSAQTRDGEVYIFKIVKRR